MTTREAANLILWLNLRVRMKELSLTGIPGGFTFRLSTQSGTALAWTGKI